MARAAFLRKGTYYYFLPTFTQGKKIIWDGMDGDGFKFRDHFPTEMHYNVNNTEMKLTLKDPKTGGPGSIFQVIGSDNIDAVMGTNPIGCVFSEFALQDPMGWDLVRPILRENGGWALFNGTPRGKNHHYKMFNAAKDNPDWHCELLDINDTKVLDEEDIQAERDAGMPEELIQQEFFCSWEGGMEGAYFARQMEKAREEGRITTVEYDPALKVDTWWDLGIAHKTAIWFTQRHMNQIRVIDYYEMRGEGLPYYAKYLSEKPYVYGEHIGPHDIGVKELGTGRSRVESGRELGLNFTIAPKMSIDDGINAVWMMLPMCWFDEKKCSTGIEALLAYRKEWDSKKQEFKPRPLEDWTSDAVDAFRTGAVGRSRAKLPKKSERYQVKDRLRETSWMSG